MINVVDNEIETFTVMVCELYQNDNCIVGGPLHIVLDDDNTSDNDILWCLDHLRDNDYVDDYIAKLCYKIGGILLMISEEDREKVVDYAWRRANRRL